MNMKNMVKKEVKSNRHCERSDAIWRDCHALWARNDGTQQGRSIFEMLGVLAIMAILSISGVGGYTLAMKKYKANESYHRHFRLSSPPVYESGDGGD